MHALLWVIGATVTILLLGGIIATHHYYAGLAHRRAAEQREQRFLADASELEQLRGGPAQKGASLLCLFQYRYCTNAWKPPATTRYTPQRQERVVLHGDTTSTRLELSRSKQLLRAQWRLPRRRTEPHRGQSVAVKTSIDGLHRAQVRPGRLEDPSALHRGFWMRRMLNISLKMALPARPKPSVPSLRDLRLYHSTT